MWGKEVNMEQVNGIDNLIFAKNTPPIIISLPDFQEGTAVNNKLYEVLFVKLIIFFK
jgi:hypothetical protein